MLKERELIKAKGIEIWQEKKCLQGHLLKLSKQLQNGGIDKQPTIINEESLQSN